MLNKEERELRKTQIGASDIHKIFNFDNKGAYDLWAEKVGLKELSEFENKYMLAGNILEEDCLIYFFNKNDIKGYELNKRIEHNKIKNFVVSTDGLFENIPVENKTINARDFSKLSKPHKKYYIQLQAQLSCTRGDYGYLVYNMVDDAVLNDPINYTPSDITQESFKIEKDIQLIAEIEERVEYFLWCVLYHREPSEADYLSKTLL